MNTVEVLSWIASSSGLICLTLVYSKNPKVAVLGPVVGLLSQPIWITFAYLTGGHGLYATSVVYTILHIKGFRKFLNVLRQTNSSRT